MATTHSTRATVTPDTGVRERILSAALDVLRTSGLRAFTQTEVAERAGVRQSHLTYYFPTRQLLLEAATARIVGGIAQGVRHAVALADAPDHAPLLTRLAEAVADVEHMRMFLAVAIEGDCDPAVRTLIVDATHQLETALADALGGDDARGRARVVLAAVWGLGLYRFAMRPSPKTDPTRPCLAWLARTLQQRPAHPGGRRAGAR